MHGYVCLRRSLISKEDVTRLESRRPEKEGPPTQPASQPGRQALLLLLPLPFALSPLCPTGGEGGGVRFLLFRTLPVGPRPLTGWPPLLRDSFRLQAVTLSVAGGGFFPRAGSSCHWALVGGGSCLQPSVPALGCHHSRRW